MGEGVCRCSAGMCCPLRGQPLPICAVGTHERQIDGPYFDLGVGFVMPQRILKVEYEFPAHVKVSKECRDLLSHILVPDPASRITIPEIQRHPWYCKDLPPGVAEMNDNLPVPTSGVQVGRHLSFLPLPASHRV